MNYQRTHLDLFSGIGGFAIAAQNCGYTTIGFCEKEPYARSVLRKHWPEVKIHDDITQFSGKQFHGVSLVTGGWPCQDISICGNGAGLDGERSGLWTHLFRVVGESEPDVCLFENSPMLKSRGYDTVKMDLERIGYRVRPYVVDARVFGADQGRIRAYILAYFVRDRVEGHKPFLHTGSPRQRRESSQAGLLATGWRDRPARGSKFESLLCGADDGIPNRAHRLRGLGNAIVPQVAEEIIRAIASLR